MNELGCTGVGQEFCTRAWHRARSGPFSLSSIDVAVTICPDSSFSIKRKQPFNSHDSQVLSRAVVWGGMSCELRVLLTRSLLTRHQRCASSPDLTSQKNISRHYQEPTARDDQIVTQDIKPGKFYIELSASKWKTALACCGCEPIWVRESYIQAGLPCKCFVTKVWDSHEVSDLYF